MNNIKKSKHRNTLTIFIYPYLFLCFTSIVLLLSPSCINQNTGYLASETSSSIDDSSLLLVNDPGINTTLSIDSLNRLATEEYFFGNYQQALNVITLAYNKAQNIDDEVELANLLNTLGLIQWRLNNNSDAIECYTQAARLADKHHLTHLFGLTQTNLALIYKAERNYEQAFKCNSKAISIFHKSNQYRELGISLNNHGQIFKNLTINDSAKYYYIQAIKNYEKISFKDGQAATYYNLAELYLRQKLEDSALLYAQKSLKLAIEVESKIRTQEANHQISEIFEYFNHPDSALKYYKIYDQINNELLTANQSTQLAKLQAELGSEVKKLQIQNLKNEQILALNRTKFIGAILIILILIITLWVYRHFSKIRFEKGKLEMELQNSKTILEIKEQELKTYILDLSKKNAIVSKLQDDIVQSPSLEHNKSAEITRLLEQKILTKEDWEQFKNKFRIIYPKFFSRINELNITLTEAEIRLLVLTHLELSGKEMATTLGISPQSVRACKTRLKKKLITNNYESVERFLSHCLLN